MKKVTQQYMKKTETKKQKLVNSFTQINIAVFVELERIKKPSKYALHVGQAFCQLV